MGFLVGSKCFISWFWLFCRGWVEGVRGEAEREGVFELGCWWWGWRIRS